jgi:Spy/CpxP family protein refolding chaperone
MLTPLALALSLLGSGLCPALAQDAPATATPGPGMARTREGGQDRWMGWMARRLNLTEAQRASIKAIQAKHQASMAGKRQGLETARRAFFEAMKKPDTPPDTLKTLNRSLSDQRLDLMLEGRAMRQEVRAVLTPDQREQAARMEGRMEGMRMAGGRRPGWGGMGMKGGRPGRDGQAPPEPEPDPAPAK